MPQTRVEPWIELWKQEGRLEGEERVEQRGRREGDQQGEKRGEQKGLRQGQAAFLLRLLERRFGVLPCWATDHVRAADTVMLEEWSLRLLDAANLDIFDDRTIRRTVRAERKGRDFAGGGVRGAEQ